MTAHHQLANAIRALSMDAVQKAKSGHPGAPMGMADIAEVLWNKHLKHNPANPSWANRDRFILSNGHGSMLLYSLLHLSGYDLSIEDIKSFRQLDSKTPGHPEHEDTPGVETTTGPLGQGLANAVGMAIAEKTLGAQFNRPEHNLIDHHTYVFAGDGCLMEGISHEVCSLAGTLGLGKLIVFYDDNGISIDGNVQGWFTDDTPQRFASYNWQVIEVDGHDAKAINLAILKAQANEKQPSLVCCKTVIGFGSPNKAGTAASHGAPLGEEEIKLAKNQLTWPYDAFDIPDSIYEAWNAKERGADLEKSWDEKLANYQAEYPQLAKELTRRLQGKLPDDFYQIADAYIQSCHEKQENLATRKASQQAIQEFAQHLPELLGGSADLAGSNLTLWKESQPISTENPDGNYLFYGVREFGMSAIANGIALYKGFITYDATFLVFMEYARNAVRMAALMKLPVIHVYTHDSIGLGEDGPTHQPIEQLASLRCTPNLHLWRPCDTVETAVCWAMSLARSEGPSALIFSRQNLAYQTRSEEQVAQIKRGGYILKDCQGEPSLILMGTGSEVQLLVEAANALTEQGVKVRVVSMPCVELFAEQDEAYKQSVLPDSVPLRLAVEAAHPNFWYQYTGLKGKVIGMESFGRSAPAETLFELFGFTCENLIKEANQLLQN